MDTTTNFATDGAESLSTQDIGGMDQHAGTHNNSTSSRGPGRGGRHRGRGGGYAARGDRNGEGSYYRGGERGRGNSHGYNERRRGQSNSSNYRTYPQSTTDFRTQNRGVSDAERDFNNHRFNNDYRMDGGHQGNEYQFQSQRVDRDEVSAHAEDVPRRQHRNSRRPRSRGSTGPPHDYDQRQRPTRPSNINDREETGSNSRARTSNQAEAWNHSSSTPNSDSFPQRYNASGWMGHQLDSVESQTPGRESFNSTRGNQRGHKRGGHRASQNYSRGGSGSSGFGRNVREQNLQDEDIEESASKNINRSSSVPKPTNQREVLQDQLSRNVYECMVCCEKVRFSHQVWPCKRCFNVFHLACIKKWATASADDSVWRCPGCQSNYESTPKDYFCFCGKMKNPKSSKYDVPHTCGQVCGKSNPGGLQCIHSCNIPCHPGPCPPCDVQMTRYCGCGKTKAQVACGSKAILSCDNVCNKNLECTLHYCSRTCHVGECGPCDQTVTKECHCRAKQKEVPCTLQSNLIKVYSCGGACGKALNCGNHKCENTCHSGSCNPCKTAVESVLSCPCGQTPIREACVTAGRPNRKSCLDPIPTCGKTCTRSLPCGDMNAKHRCGKKCHIEMQCPPCSLVSKLRCRCGNKILEIPCKEINAETDILCEKKCNKKRSCGKHKCNMKCCIDVDHICPIVCQRPLRCGNHSCTNLCHLNPCTPCGIVSFDELPCECGATIIYPPVPCGTRRPPCQMPCSREHPCDHDVHHPCHSEPNCPPCTVLTEKWCHGKHELRKNIMCYITEVSCGLPCKRMLKCTRHACPKTCHAGLCLEDTEICKLPCTKRRDSCGHLCGASCHEGECPASKCKIMSEVICPCGRRSDSMICWKREIEYDRTVTYEYHQELKKLEATSKEEYDETKKQELMAQIKERWPKSAVLECDKECARQERNRKLAEALQVENADDTTSIGTPNYSEFLTKFAKKNPQFVESVHKQLADLVFKAKQSRKKNETYGFISMNRDKRHVVHEYCAHFGMLSESFDEEPNRNVVCFASKEKSYLPSVSLIDAVFRPTIRSERLRPSEDVVFRPENRAQIVGPFNWNMVGQRRGQPEMVALNSSQTATSSPASDFPPL